MSTLVQHTNSPHYPQSTNMNMGDGAARQRPNNQASKSLSSHELQYLYEILGNNCVVMIQRIFSRQKLFILFSRP